jgi:hypothetical protein
MQSLAAEPLQDDSQVLPESETGSQESDPDVERSEGESESDAEAEDLEAPMP